MRIGGLIIGLAALTAGLSTAAQAASFTVFTDRAAFLAAAGAVTVETFDSPDETTIPFLNQTIDVGAFTITDSRSDRTPGYSAIGTRPIGGQTVNGTRFVETFGYDVGLDGKAVLAFDAPLRAFGANFVSGATNRVQLKIAGESFIKETLTPGSFFGVIGDTAFSSIVITAPPQSGAVIGFDNVTFSTAAIAVPEPASWAMMIAGFGLAGAAARRRGVRVAMT
jgi:hypothetical protein